MIFRNPLPRIDGAGPYARRVRIGLMDMGLNEAEARAWSRIMAAAMRGVCWPRMAALISAQESGVRGQASGPEIPPALEQAVTRSADGYRLTVWGMDWMVAIGQMRGKEPEE